MLFDNKSSCRFCFSQIYLATQIDRATKSQKVDYQHDNYLSITLHILVFVYITKSQQTIVELVLYDIVSVNSCQPMHEKQY